MPGIHFNVVLTLHKNASFGLSLFPYFLSLEALLSRQKANANLNNCYVNSIIDVPAIHSGISIYFRGHEDDFISN